MRRRCWPPAPGTKLPPRPGTRLIRASGVPGRLDPAEEGVEAGGEPFVAVIGPDVLAKGSQRGEAVGWQ